MEQEKANLQNRLNDQVKAGEEMQFVIKKFERDVAGLKNIEERSQGLERENGIMNKEIERLNGLIRNNVNEIKDFQIRYSRLESTIGEYKNIENKMQDL